jgi:hypothetical protein
VTRSPRHRSTPTELEFLVGILRVATDRRARDQLIRFVARHFRDRHPASEPAHRLVARQRVPDCAKQAGARREWLTVRRCSQEVDQDSRAESTIGGNR